MRHRGPSQPGRGHRWGAALATSVLLGLTVMPLAAGLAAGLGLHDVGAGLAVALHDVGWVLAPQLALAVAVLGIALARPLLATAGTPLRDAPTWLEPAIESALLLGMLGTLSGMVRGFAGLSPETLEPGPLLQALGQALRSSLVGFGIALVGVWARLRPGEVRG